MAILLAFFWLSIFSFVTSDSVETDKRPKEKACIGSLEDLITAFREKEINQFSDRSIASDNSLLNITIDSLQSFATLIVFVSTTTINSRILSQANNTSNTTTCGYACGTPMNQMSDGYKCFKLTAYRKSIYNVLPCPLIAVLGSPINLVAFSRYGQFYRQGVYRLTERKYCWNPSPFCSESYAEGILLDFIIMLGEGQIPISGQGGVHLKTRMNVNNYDVLHIRNDYAYSCGERGLYVIFLLSTIVILPVAVWMTKRTGFYLSYVQACKTSIRYIVGPLATSTKFLFWLLFIYLYGIHYLVLTRFEHDHQGDFGIHRDVHSPCSPGYYVLYTVGGIYVIEFPFLMGYIFRNMTHPGTKCLYRLFESIGWNGMVYCMQILAGYFVYFLLLFMSVPVPTLAYFSFVSISGMFFVTLFSLPIHICSMILTCCCRSSGRKGIDQLRGFCYLLFMNLVVITIDTFAILFLAIAIDSPNEEFDIANIITVFFTSGVIGLAGYYLKSIIFGTNQKQKSTNTYLDLDLLRNEELNRISDYPA